MTTVVPGYRVTVELFLPADPEQPRQIAQSAALLDSLPEQLERIGLPGASVSFRFVSRHRLPPSPPAAPDPAEPPQPLDNAPAGTVAGSASDISFGDLARAINGGPCRHPRQKRYAGGQLACLDCQAIVAEAGAA